jgi:hypothetical protein
MADYLTRLVERTLGLFPTVRPDVPPTFAMETAELAPYDAPDGYPPQRHGSALHPESSERSEEATPLARDEDQWPDKGERGYDPPPSTSTGDRAEIEHPTAGPGRADDEPPRSPEEHQRRSTPTPPDAAVPGATKPEGPNIFPDLHEAAPSRPPPRLDESPTGSSGSPISLGESPTRPLVPGARPTERTGTNHPGTDHDQRDTKQGKTGAERGQTGVAVSAGHRGAESSSAQGRAAPPAEAPPVEATVLGRGARLDLARPTVMDQPFSQSAGQEERDRAIGWEQRERTPEPSGSTADATDAVDARGRPLAEPAASSDRAERSYEPPDRPVHGTPLVPVADSPRARPAAGRVVAPHEREVAKEAPSPTVRITIGRVEVRAVIPEPAQPPPVARPEPALSLEDYLRQHDGGRR